MGKVKELRVRKGFIRRGVRVEYTVIADVDDEQDLFAAKERLEGIVDGWLTAHPEFKTVKTEAKTEVQKGGEKVLTVEEAKKLFPDDLRDYLKFIDTSEYIVLEPRQFLGAENFKRIADVVREAGGDYVSAGKESHFRIPKKKAQQ
jgi:mRNA-degrading endonuclease RelE of RelBE toxin-antitoxin system